MVPTRRQVLTGGAALLAGLGGCSALVDDGVRPDDAPDEIERPENVAMNPPQTTLRRTGARDPIVEVPDAEERSRRTVREHREAVERGFVTSREAASLLRIEDVENADRAREFLRETDFERSFVFLDRVSVKQCYRRLLCYVTWSKSELQRAYAEVYRDYDVTCHTDERDQIARFVRLDGSVDPTRISVGSTMISRGACPVPRWRLDDERSSDDGNGRVSGTAVRTTWGATDSGGNADE